MTEIDGSMLRKERQNGLASWRFPFSRRSKPSSTQDGTGARTELNGAAELEIAAELLIGGGIAKTREHLQ